MSLDSDVVLYGSGLAPLVAASHLIAAGKNVLILNPDLDFFRENSELSLDPLWPLSPDVLRPERINKNTPQQVLDALRPDFPGAIELWPASEPGVGFHDLDAPHVRSRGRLFVQPAFASLSTQKRGNWEVIEGMYVEASDAGLKPQIVEGISVSKKFPGCSKQHDENVRGILLPSLCDFDLMRYRNGLLEYVKERLGQERVLNSVSQFELTDSGVRFYQGNSLQSAQTLKGVMIFWTPLLEAWVLKALDQHKVKPPPKKFWEEWTLISRDGLEPFTAGVFDDMIVWSDEQGVPTDRSHFLKVLRPGSDLDEFATQASFLSLSKLCTDFLGWDRYAIHRLVLHRLYSWQDYPDFFNLNQKSYLARAICRSDGSAFEVIQNTRKQVQEFV